MGPRLLVAFVLAMLVAAPARADVPKIDEYPIPVETTPRGITAGPDGKIWFIDSGNHVGSVYVGRMATDGSIASSDLVALPEAGLGEAITTGPDGKMWVTEGKHIYKMPVDVSQTSQIVGYDATAYDIISGPDGRLWFDNNQPAPQGGTVSAITTGGTVTPYVPPAGFGQGLTVGPDNKIWFGENTKIARMDTSGNVGAGDEFTLPDGRSEIEALVTGPDGNVWFTVNNPAAIGRITPSGDMKFFPTPTASSLPFGIAVGPDKRIWFVERNGDNVGVIPTTATSGADIQEFPVGGPSNIGLLYITAGPDGRMWFTEFNRNKLGAITTGAETSPPPSEQPGPSEPAPAAQTPPAALTGSAPAPLPAPLPKLAQLVTLPSTKRCVSRRAFRIRLRVPKARATAGNPVVEARVLVNGRQAAVRRGKRLTAPVNLRGLPRGRFTVEIRLKLADGRTVSGKRRYHTCTTKRRSKRPPKV